MNVIIDDPVIRDAADRIKACVQRTVLEIIQIGRDLAMVKAHLGHGHYRDWLKAEFSMSERTANNFMSAYQRFGSNPQAVADLTPAVLYALAAPSTTPAVRTEALEMIKQGKTVTPKTIIELRARLREVNAERRLTAEFNRRLSHDLRMTQIERDDLRREQANVMSLFNTIWAKASEAERDQIRSIVIGGPALRVVRNASK